jgi:hypothetical protein
MNVKLNNVRLSYPNLFEAKSGPEGGEAQYSASFLLDKSNNADAVTTMRDGIFKVAEAQWGTGKIKWSGDKLFINQDGKAKEVKVCLRDGSEKPETDGYGDGVVFFSARNKSQPPVVDRNPQVRLTKDSGKPYAGCFVNASVRLWAQDNNFGKRVNASLAAVQFAGEGDSFGDAPVNPEEVFGNVAAPADQDGGEKEGFDAF